MVSLALGSEAESEAERYVVRNRLMKRAPFSYQSQGPVAVSLAAHTKGRSFEREFPDFAAPQNKGKERTPLSFPEREGDELILKSVRDATAAIRDKEMAGDYKT